MKLWQGTDCCLLEKPDARSSPANSSGPNSRVTQTAYGKLIPGAQSEATSGRSSVAERELPKLLIYVRKVNVAKNCGRPNFSFFRKNSAAATSAKGVGLVNTSKSLPRPKKPKKSLSRLVNLKTARRTISDARTATYVILSHGSGPGGRRFKFFRPDHFF